MGEIDPTIGLPRIDYARTYVLIPKDGGKEWVHAILDSGMWDRFRWTFGGSADDAGIGALSDKWVYAINPASWSEAGDPQELADFFARYYPGVQYIPLVAATPSELAVKINLPLSEDWALSMKDPRWADQDMGELAGGLTIGDAGCLLTSLTCNLRRAYRTDLTPPVVNAILARARVVFEDDAELVGWDKLPALFPIYDAWVKVNRSYTRQELGDFLASGHHVILRTASTGHFVVLERVGDLLTVVDPIDGQRHSRRVSEYNGLRSLHLAGHPDPPHPPPFSTMRGLHDLGGGQWLMDQGLCGYCVVPLYLGDGPPQRITAIDQLTAAGIDVYVRLSWSWARNLDGSPGGGAGTLPPSSRARPFLDTCIATTQINPAAAGFIFGNEMNNPREWPEGYELTPEYYTWCYNYVWDRSDLGCRLSPGPIDPYNAGWGDWRVWWPEMLLCLHSLDFFAFHCYTHGSDPLLVWADTRFEDPPLVGIHYDMRVLEDQQAAIPPDYANRPQIVAETNHWIKRDGRPGWDGDAGEWVHQAYRYFTQRGIRGACLFRYGDAPHHDWKVHDLPQILDALREV